MKEFNATCKPHLVPTANSLAVYKSSIKGQASKGDKVLYEGFEFEVTHTHGWSLLVKPDDWGLWSEFEVNQHKEQT